jgi:hypothetical protein
MGLQEVLRLTGVHMPDFNKNIKVVVTVIECRAVESFILESIDCPWDCDFSELSKILKNVMQETDYENLVRAYRGKNR